MSSQWLKLSIDYASKNIIELSIWEISLFAALIPVMCIPIEIYSMIGGFITPWHTLHINGYMVSFAVNLSTNFRILGHGGPLLLERTFFVEDQLTISGYR